MERQLESYCEELAWSCFESHAGYDLSGADKPPPHILAQWTGSGVETSSVFFSLVFFKTTPNLTTTTTITLTMDCKPVESGWPWKMIWLGWTGTMTTTTRPLMVRVRALEWSPLYLEMLKSLMELSREDFAQCWSTLAQQSLFCRSGSSRLSWDTNLMFSWLYVSLRTSSDRQANLWSLLVRWKRI